MRIDLVTDVLPWFMSAITLLMTFLQGNKDWRAWLCGLANQVLWLVYVIGTETWGLLPLNLGLWYLYVRNLVRWYAEATTTPIVKSSNQQRDEHRVQPGGMKPKACKYETCACNGEAST